MDDAVYDFISRNRELKSTGTGAFHRKSGAKSHFVGLPSDVLTPAQMKKLNGPVISFNIHRPMNIREFKTLSDTQRKLYLDYLISEYHVKDSRIAEMLGVSQNTVSYHRVRLNIPPYRKRILSPAEEEKWEAFLRGDVLKRYEEQRACGSAPEETETEQPSEEPSVENYEAEQSSESESATAPERNSAKLDSMSVTFVLSGVKNVSDLESVLATLPLREGAPATVRIEVSQ